ncbi:MAG: hypothetical protein PHO02_00735 [Candidatus Nanoarchaeia archaeon]|nr:hypothetical protein [Candidatus Nanoarchaeia archaeon]
MAKEGSLDNLLRRLEKSTSHTFDNVFSEMHDYFGKKMPEETELELMQKKYSKYSKRIKVNGQGKILSGLGELLLKYGNGSSYARETAIDLMYMLTNRNMRVKRYIAMEALKSAPMYNGTKFEGKNLTTSLVEYLCDAVCSQKEDTHFRERSIETIALLYPLLKNQAKDGKKGRYRKEIKQCTAKVRETMKYVISNKSSFEKGYVKYASEF